MRQVISSLFLAFALSGCGWLFPYEGEFVCHSSGGGICGDSVTVLDSLSESVEPIYESTQEYDSVEFNATAATLESLIRVARTNREEIHRLTLRNRYLQAELEGSKKAIEELVARDDRGAPNESVFGDGEFTDRQCQPSDELCYVFTYYANAREKPSLDATPVAVLTFRDVVRVVGYESGFFKLQNGYVKAWILRKFIKAKP
jgi:hypothetical protein